MFVKTLLRIILVFAAFCGIQYFIHYIVLTIGGFLSGIFMYKTSDDRPLALGVLIGSILFGIFAYIMSLTFPVTE